MKKIGVYAGSFDPLTYGHIWVIEEGAKIFDELIVAIGENPAKKYSFSKDTRIDMLRSSLTHLSNVRIDHFSNKFLVDYALQNHAAFILRGIRNIQDFEFEKSIRNINSDFENGKTISPVFLIPPRELSELSSSFVKGLCGPEGWEKVVEKMVPPSVFSYLKIFKSVPTSL